MYPVQEFYRNSWMDIGTWERQVPSSLWEKPQGQSFLENGYFSWKRHILYILSNLIKERIIFRRSTWQLVNLLYWAPGNVCSWRWYGVLKTDFMNFSLHSSPHTATRDLLEVFLSVFFYGLWLYKLLFQVGITHLFASGWMYLFRFGETFCPVTVFLMSTGEIISFHSIQFFIVQWQKWQLPSFCWTYKQVSYVLCLWYLTIMGECVKNMPYIFWVGLHQKEQWQCKGAYPPYCYLKQ